MLLHGKHFPYKQILNPARLCIIHICLANLSFYNVVLIGKIPLIWLIQHSNPAKQMGQGITVLIYGVCNGKKEQLLENQ